MSEFKDFVQLAAEGQVTPTFASSPGALTTAGLVVTTAQLTTQVNPGVPAHYGINSVVQAQQQLAVAPSQSHPGSRSAV